MSDTIAAGWLPAIATVLLGYVAAWHYDFSRKDASVLNRMVLTYPLPLAIFVDTITTPHAALIKDLRLLVVLSAAIVGVYCGVFLVWRFLLRFSAAESALAALIASAPSGGYVGMTSPVLGELYRGPTGIPIAISTLLNSLIVTPVTIVILTYDQTAVTRRAHSVGAHSVVAAASPFSQLTSAVLNALKQPVVWAPLLGFAMVLIGVPVPELAANLLGHASAAVALFAAGIILSGFAVSTSRQVLALVFVKNIAQPALVWAAVFFLGYSNPLLGETVVTTALPVLVITVMLGMQYRVAEREAASALLLSMLSSVVTLAGFIALTA
jgi:malonate transporter and related proteins